MSWPTYKFSDLAEHFISGGTPSTKVAKYWNGNIPWITGADFADGEVIIGRKYISVEATENSATNIVPRGAILLVTRTGVGKLALAPVDIAISQDITGVILKPQVKPAFLIAWLKSRMPLLLSAQRGATIKGITRKDVEQLQVDLPTYSEQEKIIEMLNQADALRRKRAEADIKASRILQVLFFEMFGDPATNPKGWPTQRLRELFDVNGGGTPSKSVAAYWKGQIPWVSPKDMKSDTIFDTEDHITEEAVRNSATRFVPKGSILIVYRSGILAHSFPVAFAGRDVTINQDLKAITSKGEIRNEYLFGVLTANASLGLSCVKKGATVHNIDGSKFFGLEIPKPPERLQGEFADRLGIILGYKRHRFTAKTCIDKLSKALLYQAFDGSLTAKWRETRMKELLKEMEEQVRALVATSANDAPKKSATKKGHAGHDMFNKAALAAYIVDRCHSSDHPMGRVKLAKLFYLTQKRAEVQLTEVFAKRAAGPLDDEIHKFLNLARKEQWIELGRVQGNLKPVKPGREVIKARTQAQKLLGTAIKPVDDMLDKMKDWTYKALERWATVLEAALGLQEAGIEVSVNSVKAAVQSQSAWARKLDRTEFSDEHIGSTLTGLKKHGFLRDVV